MGVRSGRHRGIAVASAAAVLVIALSGPAATAHAAAPGAAARSSPGVRTAAPVPRVQRVLILVLPGLAWRDLERTPLPNLRRFTGAAAIANLSSRAPKLRSDLASGYVTLGAGNKAVGVGPVADGSGLEPDGAGFESRERVGADRAGAVFERRTGRAATGGLVHLGISATLAANRDSAFDAEVGALGDALEASGFGRAVITNGDGSDALPMTEPLRFHRDAVAGLMGRDGTVPAGRVSDDLLTPDATQPYGVRLDQEQVEAAFDAQWRDRTVVLVEASDLVRAEAYRSVTTPERAKAVRRDALRSADRLVGRLLEHVDFGRDAVVLLGSAPERTEAALAVAAVRAPGMSAGLLRSGTTQRAGFVQLMDIAPSVLDLLDVETPDAMRGRPIEVADRGGTAASRLAFLVDVDTAARFRADIVQPVAVMFIALQCGLIVAAMCSLLGFGRRAADAFAPALASAALARVPSVYLARLAPLHDYGLLAYWAFVVLATVVLAALARLAARGSAIDAVLIGLGTIVAVLVADGVLGSPLQLNSALGFSAEVAGRFIGYGNAGYAALAAAALLLAGLVTHRLGARLGPRRAAWAGVSVLAIVLVVDGAPFWGADVGGVLSMVPAYGVAAALLLGWSVRIRTVVLLGSATLIALGAAAVLDMQRAAGDRTHLGRLVEQVQGEGFDAFSSVVRRKLEMNVASLSSSVWRVLVPIILAFVAYLAFSGARPLSALLRRIPELVPVLIGFAILLVLGYALNDTGILVPAIMLGMLSPVLVALIVPEQSPRPARTRSVEAGATGSSVDAPDA